MIEGYGRFREGDWQRQRDRWSELKEGQSPQVMVISCSDSRVDPAQILDVSPGEIFVVRNVAALVPPYETTPGQHGVSAAVEFAVQFLKVRQIVVMGHGLCGGCKAALTRSLHDNPAGEGGFVANWVSLLDEAREPVVAEHGDEGRDAERAMEYAAVRQSIANLATFPFIADKLERGEIELIGTHFAISDGKLARLDAQSGGFSAID
ncbi:carbonic anhydrase [Qipengyuania nanhaisediminis]